MKANLNAASKCAIETEPPNEKYSLRQRQKRSTRNTNKQTENSTKNDHCEASIGDGDAAAGGAATTAIASAADPSADTSAPRSTQQSKSNKKSASKTKSKQKAAPLSKYRRKTANARERVRMREINSAFEHLRQCVPTSFCESSPQNTNEKLTKITTLRMAMKYISTLTNILNSSDTTSDDTNALLTSIINKSSNQLPMGNAFINNNNDSMTINNNNRNMKMETKVTSTTRTTTAGVGAAAVATSNKGKPKGKSKKATNAKANKTISKRKSSKSKASTKSTNKTIPIENNLALKSQMYESIPNTINTLCLTPPLSSTDSPIDLGLMLESDGESLHLSEPCLSPPLSSTSTPSSSNQKQFISTTVTPPASMTMSNGLDIGLFLDSDTDSLHFPEPCLSPLDGGFDAFSPFGDLLNPGFPEHSSLDIYLT